MLEERQLSKVRNVGMDVQATLHMMEARKTNSNWTCPCMACEYVRKEPRLVSAIQKALDKDSAKSPSVA